jgi:hypothetical protein
LLSVAWSPPGYVPPDAGPGHDSLGVVEEEDPLPPLNAVVSAAPNAVCDVGVLSSSDISAEFSIVGSRLNQVWNGMGSSPLPVGAVVEVVDVEDDVEVDVVVVVADEHEKLGSPHPAVNAGLP